MTKRTALTCAVVLALAGCSGQIDQQPVQAAMVDAGSMPAAGIYTVKDVIVADEGQDTITLKAAATNKFTFADLTSVVWCRAREEAVKRKYDGWYQDGIQQVSNGPDQPQVAIGKAHFFKGKAPEGKKTLRHEKSPCKDIPAVAKSSV